MHEEHQGGASGEAPWYGHEKPRVLGLERLESDGRKACGGSGGRAARMDRDTAAVVPVSRRTRPPLQPLWTGLAGAWRAA